MRNLKTIEGKVKAILEKDEEARNDDMLLYLKVCNTCLKDTGAMPFAEVMLQYRYLGLPSIESVGRTRRKLQAEFPELMGSSRVQKLRAAGEKAYRKHERTGNIRGDCHILISEVFLLRGASFAGDSGWRLYHSQCGCLCEECGDPEPE